MRQHKVFLRHELLKYNSEKSTAKSSALENYISSANLSLSGCSSAEPDSVSVGACKFQMKKLYLQTVKKVDHLPLLGYLKLSVTTVNKEFFILRGNKKGNTIFEISNLCYIQIFSFNRLTLFLVPSWNLWLINLLLKRYSIFLFNLSLFPLDWRISRRRSLVLISEIYNSNTSLRRRPHEYIVVRIALCFKFSVASNTCFTSSRVRNFGNLCSLRLG